MVERKLVSVKNIVKCLVSCCEDHDSLICSVFFARGFICLVRRFDVTILPNKKRHLHTPEALEPVNNWKMASS
ncbi:hypothetical protein SAY87_024007 [Trapa incisa]|uniref:Uncharacterized protein n=1 Tax=Trapa incisa TaxID=236973 RepID=A0AAN7L7D9_9MYRT|nr:hypothetical protein SAY87_024007 [Trapa incisa]